jgi:tight adherence protein C
MIFALIFGAMGYYVPTLWLGRAINRRRGEIQNGLPDAIDLMIVCIEAGSGIDQALNRVAEELAIAYPALARELELVSAETRAGKPRLEAFRNFADRTKVDDVRSLVAMLIQTDRFGTSIGQALRTHAETSRTKRRQRAEEKAAKLAVKLLFPLVFCLFPAFYVIVLGPSMLSLFRHFVYGFGA